MKLPILKIIYGLCALNIALGILFVLFPDTESDKYIYGINAFISLIIILGLRDRNNFIRKFTIVYYGIGVVFGALQVFIGIPYVLLSDEYNFDITSSIISVIILGICILIIRGLNSEPLLSEFTSNNSLNQTGANDAPPG